MTKGIFLHRSNSRYDDIPDRQYQFPERYLKRAAQMRGDWILYFEPKKGGRQAYFAIAKIGDIIPDPMSNKMYLAFIEPGTYLEFDQPVPFNDAGIVRETSVLNEDGLVNRGLIQWAIREVSEYDFWKICDAGFYQEEKLPRIDSTDFEPAQGQIGLHEISQQPYQADIQEIQERERQLISRRFRDERFRGQILRAYDNTCAFTGLKFINGGGRAEVEAAHIKPVKANGPDHVRNGLALSGTVHWMFDRGLLSLANDHEIMISRHLNDQGGLERLLPENRRAILPVQLNLQPHPSFLAWHRENCFKH